jgi:hypothetical protein
MKQRLTEATLEKLGFKCGGQFKPNARRRKAPIPPKLPDKAGVYAIMIGDVVEYFGQAADLNRRMRDYGRDPDVPSATPAQKRVGKAVIDGKTVLVWYAIVRPMRWHGLFIYPAIAVEAAVMREYAKPPVNQAWLPRRSKPDDRPVGRP